MSSEHVEIVQREAAAMGLGDVEALIRMCTDDALFLPRRSALHGGQTGPEGVRTWLADNAETFEVFTATRTDAAAIDTLRTCT